MKGVGTVGLERDLRYSRIAAYNASRGLIESVRQVWRDDRIFRDGFE